MNTKMIFDTVYAVLFLVAILVGIYATKHTSNNKIMLFIEDLATAFVHEAETTGGDGKAKMNAVISEVTRVLTAQGVKVDPTIEAAVRAYAEKEVAKMNPQKPSKEQTQGTATAAGDFDEEQIGADGNA